MSKKKETITKLREKTKDELGVYAQELEKSIRSNVIEKGFGRLDDVRTVKNQRKELAQAKTVLRELELQE